MMRVRIRLLVGFFLLPTHALADMPSQVGTAASVLGDTNRQDLLARKHIRGEAVDGEESDELKGLREFENGLRAQNSLARTTMVQIAQEKLSGEDESKYLEFQPLLAQANVELPDPTALAQQHFLRYLDFYKNDKRGRSILTTWLRNQGRYRSLIEAVLQKHNLPSFLLYVAMIESGYDPHDKSNKGAVGLWQFMPEGARIYGLRVDYWVDERKDPSKATEAVALYFQDLKERFGTWKLALAAFNAGYGAVLKSVNKYNTNDYWTLCETEAGLPWETVLYVPKVFATAMVGENKELFGYQEIKPDEALAFQVLPVAQSLSLGQVAQWIDTPESKLVQLNPHLRRKRIPPLAEGETYPLHIPLGVNTETFAKKAKEGAAGLARYVVRFGETPAAIAKRMGIPFSSLKKTNGFGETSEVRPGTVLLIPKEAAKDSVKDAEDELVVVAQNKQTPKGKKRVFYQVVDGDTVLEIAAHFKVKSKDLASWNALDLEAILPTKLVLQLWVDPDFDDTQTILIDPKRVVLAARGSEDFTKAVEALQGRKRVVHFYKAGETLESIGQKYHMSVASVIRANYVRGITLPNTTLVPGKEIVVYEELSSEEKEAALLELRQKTARAPDESSKEIRKNTPMAASSAETGDVS